jgi:hypothetical protein
MLQQLLGECNKNLLHKKIKGEAILMFGLHILGFSSRWKFRTQFKRKHHSKGILMNDLPV